MPCRWTSRAEEIVSVIGPEWRRQDHALQRRHGRFTNRPRVAFALTAGKRADLSAGRRRPGAGVVRVCRRSQPGPDRQYRVAVGRRVITTNYRLSATVPVGHGARRRFVAYFAEEPGRRFLVPFLIGGLIGPAGAYAVWRALRYCARKSPRAPASPARSRTSACSIR